MGIALPKTSGVKEIGLKERMNVDEIDHNYRDCGIRPSKVNAMDGWMPMAGQWRRLVICLELSEASSLLLGLVAGTDSWDL